MLKDLPKEEIEIMSENDLSYSILKEKKKSMNTPDLFQLVCKLQSLSDNYFDEAIGDFYTSLVTDKRFVLLDDSNEWDLRDHRAVLIEKDDDDDDDYDDIEDEEEIEEEIKEEEEEDDDFDDDIDDDDDGLEGLNIIPDEELEDD